MSTVGSIDVQIRADISNLQQNLRTMQNRMQATVSNVATQTNSMANSFSRMSKTIGASIATYVVYKGLNLMTTGLMDTIKVYNQFESASMGLKSILDAQGKSFSDAQTFIKSYVSDGLIPMSDAVTAFKTLSAAGFNIDQTEQLMLRLKDASAFGRQASLTMGEAVRSAAEGIKNENSILLDNSGITKNLSLMWKDYASSIDKGTNSLSKNEKNQGTFQGVMSESTFQVGDAAKYSATLGGGLAALSSQFTQLKGAIGAVFAPALQAIMPFIAEAIVKFTMLVNTLSSFSKAIFGTSTAQNANQKTTVSFQKSQNQAIEGAKGFEKGQKKIADGAKKVNKALASNTQGFDELNQVRKESPDNGADTDTGGGADSTGGGGGEVATKGSGDNEIKAPTIDLSKPLEMWKKFNDMLSGPKKALGELVDALILFNEKAIMPNLRNLGELIGGLFKKAIDSELFEKAINVIKESINLLGEIIVANQPLLDTLFDVLQSLGGLVIDALAFSLEVLGDAIAFLGETIKKYPNVAMFVTIFAGLMLLAPPVIAFFTTVSGIIAEVIAIVSACGGVVGALSAAWGALVGMAGALIAGISLPVVAVVAVIAGLVTAGVLLYQNWDLIKQKASEVWESIKAYVSNAWDSIKQTLAPVTSFISNIWESVKNNVSSVWNWIKEQISSKIELIKTVLSPITNFISEIWESVKTNVSETFEFIKSVIDPISNFVKEVFDRISTFVSQAWDIVKAIILTIVAFVDIFVIAPIKSAFSILWTSIKELFIVQWDLLKETLLKVWTFINDQVIKPITKGFKLLWDGLLSVFTPIWKSIQNKFLEGWNWIDKNIITPLKNGFAILWTGIETAAGMAWNGIKEVGKLVINGVLTNVETFVNVLVLAINKLIGIMNKIKFTVPSWVPDIGGQTFGITLEEISRVNIPKLATGGIVNKSTIAEIGEGNSAEAIIPLNEQGLAPLINGIVNAMSQVFSDLRTGNNNQQPLNVNLTLDGETLSRATYKYNQTEQNRRSSRLVTVV